MKKIMLSVVVFMFALCSICLAAPYKSNNVPPENLLMVTLSKVGTPGFKILGKLKHSDNSYSIYCFYPKGNMFHASLIMLDTNIWLVNNVEIVEE